MYIYCLKRLSLHNQNNENYNSWDTGCVITLLRLLCDDITMNKYDTIFGHTDIHMKTYRVHT